MTGLESLATQGVHVLSFSKDVERKFQRCGEEIPKMWRGNSKDVERKFQRCGEVLTIFH